jgi:hypothetical protein
LGDIGVDGRIILKLINCTGVELNQPDQVSVHWERPVKIGNAPKLPIKGGEFHEKVLIKSV